MKLKKIIPFLLLASLVLFGCNFNSDDPSEVLGDFFTAMSRRNFEDARRMATVESKSMIDMMELAVKTNPDEMGRFDLRMMALGDPVVNGDKATVPVTDRSNGEVMDFPLKRIDNAWKVRFEEEVILDISTQKMKNSSIEFDDSMLNNLPDSLVDTLPD
jgi:hypothetical protein